MLNPGECRSLILPDDHPIFGGFMRDLGEWINVRLGNSRQATPQQLKDGIFGTMIQSIMAKRANHVSLTTGNGAVNEAARSIDDNGTQLLDCEVGLARPRFARTRLIGSVVRDISRHNWPLREAQLRVEELASANRRKDEFLAMLSHELRSPLGSLHYAVRLLGRQLGGAPAQQRLQALIERQLGRMTHLVDELLDVSRITSGRLHLQRERIDLRVIVSNAIETLESDINERKHRLSTELSDAPIWLLADRHRLEQVFVNLLANASRYTDPSGELTVWVHAREGQGIVRIRDSGIGIAAEALPHIFDLFNQGNETDPRSKAGLGVGLAVVRNLVELHGGSVAAASAGTGQGSEFTVRLPTEH